MNHTEHQQNVQQSQSDRQTARQPYVKPEVETLGGALTTLLASGCQCAICPPDPQADNV